MEVAPAESPEVEAPVGPTVTRWSWVGPATLGAVGVGVCTFVRVLNPVVESNPPACPFKMMTGHDCPGCGATRALNALLHGHPAVAADHNVLFVALLPVAAALYLSWALRSVGVAVPPVRFSRTTVALLVVLVALFWALRLLPWDPFTWLASGA